VRQRKRQTVGAGQQPGLGGGDLDERGGDRGRRGDRFAGFAEAVEIRVGAALQTLPQLVAEGTDPFDLIFIDADKANNPGYFEWSLKLSRPGTLIITDNVVRDGAILDPGAYDPELGDKGIQGVRRFFDLVATESRVSATAIQTVGAKGYDGFALVLVGGQG